MNEIPIVNLIPEKYRGWAVLIVGLLPILGRAYHAIVSGGGLKSIFSGLIFGTNAPQDNPAPGRGTQLPLSMLLALGVPVAVVLTLLGCASLTTSDVTRIASASKQAATIGTSEVLTAHPDWKPQFQKAADDLATLANSPTISVNDILAITQRLPVKELKSQTARLSFEGAMLFISAIDVPEVPADRLAQLQPIAQAISDGIIAGMNAPPAK